MLWPILQEKAREQKLPLAIVVAEVLHLIVLDALFAQPESLEMTFQGGTSIHLLHGGYRYSEDLDFAGEHLDQALAHRLVTASRSNIEKVVLQLLGRGHCVWRFPTPSADRRVCAFWLHVQPEGLRQRFRVKMEFARYPVYNPQVLAVRSEFDVLQWRPLIHGLSVEELLAEKVAAVAGRPHMKGRDLFDLWYLVDVLGASLEGALVGKKFRDYSVHPSASALRQKLMTYRADVLTAEMERFLPARHRHLLQGGDYEVIRRAAVRIIEPVLAAY